MITNEQANELYKILDKIKTEKLIYPCNINDKYRDKIDDVFREIAANKPTNGDRWRAMTDEQIAEIIRHNGCCACPVDEYICGQETAGSMCEEEFNRRCKAAIVKWLKEEAKDND